MQFRLSLLVVAVFMTVLPVLATSHTVTVQNFSFNPSTLTVSQGDTVIWNCVQGRHNVHHTGTPTLFHKDVQDAPWTYTVVFDFPAGDYPYVCQPHQPNMGGTISVVPLAVPEVPSAGVVNEVSLAQNYPNPFNGTTQIAFAVPNATQARLSVINVLGQQVAELFRGPVAAGQHVVRFDAQTLPSGIYFYKLEAGSATLIRTMQFIK